MRDPSTCTVDICALPTFKSPRDNTPKRNMHQEVGGVRLVMSEIQGWG